MGAESDRTSQLTLRDLTGREEYERGVELQCQTWGADCGEIVPPAVLMLVQKVGGVVIGAFEPEGDLVGLVFGVTGVQNGELVHWSHLAAVREDRRSQGIGQALKWEQRRRLRAMGVGRALWTFDPLVARNANLNLNKLGARILEYMPDLYGVNAKAKPDTIIGSDRCLVEWELQEEQPPRPGAIPDTADAPTISVPDTVDLDAPLPTDPMVLIMVPGDIQALKVRDPVLAKAWRKQTRRAFLHYLGAGYRVTRFVHDMTAGGGFYILQEANGTV